MWRFTYKNKLIKKLVDSKAGFPKVGRIAPRGAILMSWGSKICKGAKGGRKFVKGQKRGDLKILGSHNFFYF